MRQCPTLEGDARSLITHTIEVEQCLSRQRCFYHKCHRCAYRGQPAAFVLEPQEFGRGTVEVPPVEEVDPIPGRHVASEPIPLRRLPAAAEG